MTGTIADIAIISTFSLNLVLYDTQKEYVPAVVVVNFISGSSTGLSLPS